eukprot:scaffold93529_cov30-Tisochrysis_lutea.AAC.1
MPIPCNIPAIPGGSMPAIPGGSMPAIPGGSMPAIPGGNMPAIPGGIMPGGIMPGGIMPGGIMPGGIPCGIAGMPTGMVPGPIPGTIGNAGRPTLSLAGAGALAPGSLRDFRFGIASPSLRSSCFLLVMSGTVSSPVTMSRRLTRTRPRASASLG